MNLDTRVTALNRVGQMLTNRLKKLGIVTVRDLLFHFPFRYEDFSVIVPIDKLVHDQEVTVQGVIELIASRRSQRKRTMLTEAVVTDGTAQLKVIWFGQAFISKTLKMGDKVSLSGKIKEDRFGMQMVSPSFEKLGSSAEAGSTHTGRIVPMYPLTQGVTQKQLRFLTAQVIEAAGQIQEWLPDEIRDKADLMPLSEALRAIHFPESNKEHIYAERRLKFDEVFVLQLRAELIRQSARAFDAPHIPFDEVRIKEFVASLPFDLTRDQKMSAWEIFQDMEKIFPMNRLLEGDVGSGKTVVAALAALAVTHTGYQAAVMAPTEILAKQHYASFQHILPNMTIGLLTSSECRLGGYSHAGQLTGDDPILTKGAARTTFKQHIQDGSLSLVVGTHALLTDDVVFHNLGLVVVDEQHRFGVEQRKRIRAKSGNKKMSPHFLSMTATPIPRSFALTLYGDLDVSIIKTMPAGRKPIKTRVVETKNRGKAYQFIRDQVGQGRQIFVICPMIGLHSAVDEPQTVDVSNEKKSVVKEYEKLSKEIFSDLRVSFLHGKMRPKEKEDIMAMFAKGGSDILVSTSVVEVGVDVPNASVMMIEDGEKFGLAQLHQFRGRVGRSTYQSYCFVFTQTDSQSATERLNIFESTTDGFRLAEYDLETRGPGEVYGTSQSGMQNLRLATMRDTEIIKLARDMARDIDFDAYPTLKTAVREWEEKVHLE